MKGAFLDRRLASGLSSDTARLDLAASVPGWRVLKPSNTGIPGEAVTVVRFAPDGRLWVGAYWPFWRQGGLGVYDIATETWTDYSNWETPLPSEYVTDLAFGPNGVVWIATDAGLAKKDGDIWTVYTTANSPLLHNYVLNITLGANGHLWVNNTNPSSQIAALFEFDGTNWRKFQAGQQLPWSATWGALNDVLVDHRGHVWVTNQVLNGVAEYNGVSWTLRGAGVDRFDDVAEDAAGNIWLKAGVGGYNNFYRYDHVSFTTYPEPTSPTVISIDDQGAVYLGNWNGRVRKSTNGGQSWSDVLTGLNPVLEIAPRPTTTEIWIGTVGAVGQFGNDGSWKRDFNTYNTGLPWYMVDRMSEDREGNFWVATGEAGLSRFDGARWRNWGEHNAGAEPYPFAGSEPMGASYEDRGGDHWMGGNGIARWDAKFGRFSGFWNWQNNPGITPTIFAYFAEDGAGRLFAATTDGLIYSFDGNEWVREPVSPYVVSGDLPGMHADSLGNVWVAGTYALYRWDGHSWAMFGDEWLFWDWGGVTALAVGPDDTLWIGTASGLARWDGVSLVLFDPTNSPLPAHYITGIDVREEGTIGVAAADFSSVTPFPSGVAVIRGDPSSASSWTVNRYGESPLPHYQLGSVAFDPQGTLWISAVSEGVALLQGCRSDAWINLVRPSYGCGSNATIGLTDCDLNLDPTTAETVLVRVTSSSEPAGRTVQLTEIAANAGVFMGTLPLSSVSSPGALRVGNGDTIEVSYLDAYDGAGGQNILRTDAASATCSVTLFTQTLRALDRTTFGWTTPSDVDWVRGSLSHLSTYGTLELGSAFGVVSIAAPEQPAPGSGFYWLVRPHGANGSWSSGGAGECNPASECPAGGRDGNLP